MGSFHLSRIVSKRLYRRGLCLAKWMIESLAWEPRGKWKARWGVSCFAQTRCRILFLIFATVLICPTATATLAFLFSPCTDGCIFSIRALGSFKHAASSARAPCPEHNYTVFLELLRVQSILPIFLAVTMRDICLATLEDCCVEKRYPGSSLSLAALVIIYNAWRLPCERAAHIATWR